MSVTELKRRTVREAIHAASIEVVDARTLSA
jgi:hypothetical protein